MCKDQLAQIDCRKTNCIFHSNGRCNNISPAITLDPGNSGRCWSYKENLEDEA